MTQSRSPAVDRRVLADALRSMREHRGMPLDEAAREALDASAAKLSRLETGKQVAVPRDVRDLCRLYGADQAQVDHLVALAVSSREVGWWETYGLDHGPFVGYEAGAVEILQLENSIVPGLLQVREYTEMLLNAVNVSRAVPWSPDESHEFLELLARRAKLLEPDSGVKLSYVLDESVFVRAVVGAHMVDQIDRIIELSLRPNIDVRLLPFAAGVHPAQLGGFTILTLPGEASDLVYMETYSEATFHDSENDLARFRQLFHSVQDLCLSQAATREALKKIRESPFMGRSE